jgi:hypothetical protein
MQALMRVVDETTTGAISAPFLEPTFLSVLIPYLLVNASSPIFATMDSSLFDKRLNFIFLFFAFVASWLRG